MSDLTDLVGRFRLTPAERRDFHRTDTEAILAKVRLLTSAAVFFNTTAVVDYGGSMGSTRAMELVEQVIGAAFQTYGGKDPHPDEFAKAAMLLRGITAGHPFQDGNKRTGFLVAYYYLEEMGFPAPPDLPVGEVVTLSRSVSAGDVRDVSVIAAALEEFWQR